jgi:hypothetical protein
MAAEYSGLRLWLAFPAHRAIGHHPAVVQLRQRGIERVERLAPGLSAPPAFGQRNEAPRFCQVMPVRGRTARTELEISTLIAETTAPAHRPRRTSRYHPLRRLCQGSARVGVDPRGHGIERDAIAEHILRRHAI